MRIFISFLTMLLALAPVYTGHTAENAVTSKVEKIIEKPKGPLAPDDSRLDGLYAKLKRERNPEVASALADEIRQTLEQSGSATVDLLMANAAKAVTDKHYGAALDFLDLVTLVAPDFAEGWNRRATLHYLMGNSPKAMSDTARVLALEPRHIGALAGMAGILEEAGRDTDSLQAWESYLALYPADRDAQKEALDLINKLAGQKI